MSSNNKPSMPSNPYSANLTDLLNNKSVKLISDPEGYSFTHLLNQSDDSPVLASETEPLIVLGDILDSTAVGNILKMVNLAELKSHNLDNLLQCRDNPNIHLMFGNRDLNKLKVLPLTLLYSKNNSSTISSFFLNEQNADYLTLASILKQNINDEKWFWQILDLKHWYPFWKTYKDGSDEKKLWDSGRHSEYGSIMTCLERFFLIFGADNKDGTMSAFNLLYCIPYEVLHERNRKGNNTNKNFKTFKEAFPKFSAKCSPDTDINLGDYKSVLAACDKEGNKGLKEELELAAALVLTVFMRMFIKPSSTTNTNKNTNKFNINRKLKYDGLLYDLFMSKRTYFCAWANSADRLLAFSHGGITKNLLATNYGKRYNMFFSISKKSLHKKNTGGINVTQYTDPKYYNIMTHSNLKTRTNLNGGFYKKINDGSTSEHIHKSISDFNAKNKHLVSDTLKHYLVYLYTSKQLSDEIDYAPTSVLVKLMALTSGFNSCMHNKYVECNRSNPDKLVPYVDSAAYSPIMPGLKGLRKPDNTIYCKDKSFVQFIGHSPHGFGATIDLFKAESSDIKFNTYNVNLDVSNTVLTNDTVSNLEQLSENYLYMVYSNKGELTAHGNLHVADIDKFNAFPDKTIKYNDTFDLLSNEFMDYLIHIEPSNQDAYIHGILVDDKNKIFYSTAEGFDYTPMITKLYGFNNETTRNSEEEEAAEYGTLPIHPPFSKHTEPAMIYGGSRKTKRQSSKKYKRSQTKKLKRK
jgi:hypothetical protein